MYTHLAESPLSLMKLLHLFLALVALTSAAFAGGPPLRLDQAATIAQQHLKERGLDGSRYIVSVVLDKETVGGTERYWYAKWSESVKLEERKTEIGVRINMDGSVVRVVESAATQPKNYRTRSDRPSILDLK